MSSASNTACAFLEHYPMGSVCSPSILVCLQARTVKNLNNSAMYNRQSLCLLNQFIPTNISHLESIFILLFQDIFAPLLIWASW